MRNVQFLNRLAPCLAIMTISSVAAFALPTASYAATGACKAVPPLTAPNTAMGANGQCPQHYVPVDTEDPQALPVTGAPVGASGDTGGTNGGVGMGANGGTSGGNSGVGNGANGGTATGK
jgi:hypothetical protein